MTNHEHPSSHFGDKVRYSWTQPCCDDCWNERNPDRQAYKFVEKYREKETCVYCGNTTQSGIYVRVDPAEAKYPTLIKE